MKRLAFSIAAVAAAVLIFWLNDREVRREAAFQARAAALSQAIAGYVDQRAADRRLIADLTRSIGQERRVAVVAETLYVALSDTIRVALPDTLQPLFARLDEAHGRQVRALNAALDSSALRFKVAESRLSQADSIVDATRALLRVIPRPVRWQAALMVDSELRLSVCAVRAVGRLPILRLPVSVGGCYRT